MATRTPISDYKLARRASLPPYQALLEKYADTFSHKDKAARCKGFEGEGSIGTYGSITFRAQLLLTWELMAGGELPSCPALWAPGAEPVVVDFGAGIGRPLMLWQSLNLVLRGIGYEFDEAKVSLAAPYMHRVLTAVRFEERLPVRTDPPRVELRDVAELKVAEVAAHRPTLGYSFCAGMPPEAKTVMGRLFRGCRTMRSLVLVTYGEKLREELAHVFGEEEGQEAALGSWGNIRTLGGLRQMASKATYTAVILTKKPPPRTGPRPPWEMSPGELMF